MLATFDEGVNYLNRQNIIDSIENIDYVIYIIFSN